MAPKGRVYKDENGRRYYFIGKGRRRQRVDILSLGKRSDFPDLTDEQYEAMKERVRLAHERHEAMKDVLWDQYTRALFSVAMEQLGLPRVPSAAPPGELRPAPPSRVRT